MHFATVFIFWANLHCRILFRLFQQWRQNRYRSILKHSHFQSIFVPGTHIVLSACLTLTFRHWHRRTERHYCDILAICTLQKAHWLFYPLKFTKCICGSKLQLERCSLVYLPMIGRFRQLLCTTTNKHVSILTIHDYSSTCTMKSADN